MAKPDPKTEQTIKSLTVARNAAESAAVASSGRVFVAYEYVNNARSWGEAQRTALASLSADAVAAAATFSEEINKLACRAATLTQELDGPPPIPQPVSVVGEIHARMRQELDAAHSAIDTLHADRERMQHRSAVLARVEADGLPSPSLRAAVQRLADAKTQIPAKLPYSADLNAVHEAIYHLGLLTVQWVGGRKDALELARASAAMEPSRDVFPVDLSRPLRLAFHGQALERDENGVVTRCVLTSIVVTPDHTDPHALPLVPLDTGMWVGVLASGAGTPAIDVHGINVGDTHRNVFVYADRFGVGRPIGYIAMLGVVEPGHPLPDGRTLDVPVLVAGVAPFDTDTARRVAAAIEHHHAAQEANKPANTAGIDAGDDATARDDAGDVAGTSHGDVADLPPRAGPDELPEAPGGADQAPPREPAQAPVA